MLWVYQTCLLGTWRYLLLCAPHWGPRGGHCLIQHLLSPTGAHTHLPLGLYAHQHRVTTPSRFQKEMAGVVTREMTTKEPGLRESKHLSKNPLNDENDESSSHLPLLALYNTGRKSCADWMILLAKTT